MKTVKTLLTIIAILSFTNSAQAISCSEVKHRMNYLESKIWHQTQLISQNKRLVTSLKKKAVTAGQQGRTSLSMYYSGQALKIEVSDISVREKKVAQMLRTGRFYEKYYLQVCK